MSTLEEERSSFKLSANSEMPQSPIFDADV